jgi:guanylate kinase
VVVISGPSGVGKDTLIERMAELGHRHHFTITATTREPRPGERDGINHHFVSRDEFINMIASDELLEWAEVFGNYYGVPRQQVRDALARGQHVLIRVDVQGARRLRELLPGALQIFVMPPSRSVLRKRLKERGVNSAEDMKRRLKAAQGEIQEAGLFDYVVVNEEGRLDDAVREVSEIFAKESRRQPSRNVTV